ncbi:MAG: hypothetical protein ACOCV2_14910 [Persicimonas sp.]
MAEISLQVANRIKWARFVLASYRIHGKEVEGTLADQYDGLAGYDGDQMADTLAALAARLANVTDAMRGAEMALAAELADDDQVRDERDELVERLREELYGARDASERTFGEDVAAAYGLAGTPPQQSDSLLAYGRNAVNLMRDEPRSNDDVFGNTIDTDKMADKLEQTLDELEDALEALDTEKREAHAVRAERDEVVEEWTQVYRGTANALSGLYLLAGRKDLAERVRPTVRRSSGRTEPPEDAEEQLEDVDEPVEDEEPVEDDEPVDDDEPVEV